MCRSKASSRLFWYLFFIYTIHVMGKISFSASTVALIHDGVLTKTQAGMISGVFWLSYATGQFFGGFITEKASPYILMHLSIASAASANFILGCSDSYLLMLIVWGLSGILQFGLWPSVLKLISTEVIPSQRATAMERLAVCFCLGSGVSYVAAATILKISNWRSVFFFYGVMCMVTLMFSVLAQIKLSPILKNEAEHINITKVKEGKLTKDIVWKSGLIFFCVLGMIKSIADQGIKNWMPTIMLETYDASPSFTSLLSVVLLATNLVGVFVARYVYHQVKCDELKTLRILYIACVPLLLFALDFQSMNIFVFTILMSVATLLLYGSSQILTIQYPAIFHRRGLTVTVGGIVNSFVCVGNMVGSYGSGYVADHYSWNTMIGVWNALIIIFVIITFAIIPIWKQFRGK